MAVQFKTKRMTTRSKSNLNLVDKSDEVVTSTTLILSSNEGSLIDTTLSPSDLCPGESNTSAGNSKKQITLEIKKSFLLTAKTSDEGDPNKSNGNNNGSKTETANSNNTVISCKTTTTTTALTTTTTNSKPATNSTKCKSSSSSGVGGGGGNASSSLSSTTSSSIDASNISTPASGSSKDQNNSFAAADSNSGNTPSKSFVPCKVCGDKASGYHYGVTSCEGCKGFFRRSIQKQIEYRCLRDGKCLVIRLNRNRCQYCRFKKCLAVGMSRDSVRYGRVPKRSRERSGGGESENRVTQSDADESTRELENKQLAMYDIILTISQAHHAHCAYTEEKTRGIIRKPAIFSLDVDYGVGSSVDGSPPWMTPDSLEQQKISMWQQFAAFVTPSIQRVVEFAKRIPSFLELTQDDQLIMIKLGFFEVWLVHVSRMTNTMENTLTFSDGTFVTKQQMELMFDHEFVSAIFNFMVMFNSLQLNDTEIGIFAAIVLLQSERPGIYDVKTIDRSQKRLLEALKLQVARNHPSESQTFANAVMNIPELRNLGLKHAEHLQWFRSNWTRVKLPPLFAEIFDIPNGPKVEDEFVH